MTLKSTWIDFLYKSATGTKNIRTLLTPIGALFFGLFTFSFVWVALEIDAGLDLPDITWTPWNLIIGSLLIMIGLWLTGWSVYYFLRTKGTPVPINPPPTLVDKGPYYYIRNPMLSGIFLLLFGLGFCLSSFSLIVIFTPLFIVINTLELKLIEEPELKKRLGSVYTDYKKRTPMFIPGWQHLSNHRQ
jgi:protein-S-isoprenylcysteine O-methyltransferase Ste14